MRRNVIIIVLKVLATVGLLTGALAVYAHHAAERVHEIPLPRVTADRRAEAVARGAAIFHATCETCHRAPESARAAGAPMHEAPPWIGRLHAANLTADATAGIARVPDASLARTVRHGVDRDGRWVPMPAYALSDDDLAAVLGFLRSEDPLFSPDPRAAPRSELTTLGTLVLFLSGTFTPPDAATEVTTPARAASAAYGRYLAESVYQCGDCHTPGFDRDKVRGPEAYSGSAELKDPHGQTIYAANLTPDLDTGLGGWTRDRFARAVRAGVRGDGSSLSAPMPQFRAMDDLEIDALLAFLRSLPAVRQD